MAKIAIVLTSLNHGKYIREAIESVLRQTFQDFELIIWDDASTDDSWDIIKSYNDPRIKIFQNETRRRGIFGLNKAIMEHTSGKYVAIHHSDDIWESDKLLKQFDFLERNNEIGAVFTNVIAAREDGVTPLGSGHFYSEIFSQPNRSRYEWLNYFFYNGNALCHPSAMIRRDCFLECGTYRYGFAQLADFEMWTRLCLKYEIHVLDEKLLTFRVRDDELNFSGNRIDSRIRVGAEQFKVFENYFKITTFDEFVKIFPEGIEFYSDKGYVAEYVVAMLALKKNCLPSAKAFGIFTLFNLVSNGPSAAKLKEVYNFDYIDFVSLTGKYDVFSVESNAKLSQINLTLLDYHKRLKEKDDIIAMIYSTRSWRFTKPLRWISQLFQVASTRFLSIFRY